MMRFSHSTNGGSAGSFPIRCAAAILLAALSGGCSASISRFDGPSFSLNDDKKDQTSSLQTADVGLRFGIGVGRIGHRVASAAPGSLARLARRRVVRSRWREAPDGPAGGQTPA